ncbi:hypothetical protein PFICI_07513 [Pestalotiopsis fici W106-1]|uniref:Uncharacterized protein n=1 Tax=Pestalotiopsis fici (strain W106-1 / CGMCC3.15140) TaxID=1229662 RepID=W3X1U1_PESFW|nr:uncharacterized protein PFICI_07513 [Pestalotiopsis fici W106-1]ETS79984.1 hypothetical protein PFICI_07513 [Pestalotiopsis fici W106-1]
MKAISTLRSAFAKLLLKTCNSRNDGTSKLQSEGTDWNSSYAATTDYYQPTLRTKTAVRNTKAERRPGLYYVRKKGSTRAWVEKVDKNGIRTQLTRPSGAGKVKPGKQQRHNVDDRSRWDSQSQWTAQEGDRTVQYVMSQDPRTYDYDTSSIYSQHDE